MTSRAWFQIFFLSHILLHTHTLWTLFVESWEVSDLHGTVTFVATKFPGEIECREKPTTYVTHTPLVCSKSRPNRALEEDPSW